MTSPATILVVDDHPSARALLQHQLEGFGFAVIAAAGAAEGLTMLERQPVDLILSDLVMPGMNGLAFLAVVRERFSAIPFVVITAHGSVATAVDALKQGAFDYIDKNCSPDELLIILRRAISYQSLVTENEGYRRQLEQKFSFQSIVTANPLMKRALELAASVAAAPATTVAIFGESGCGKEVLARAIHVASGGKSDNYVGINCAAIPESLLESELFGHVRGAFTGAERDQEGMLALAKGGTLLLDEIGDMPLVLQGKLLRVLEERSFVKVGSHRTVPVECRIIVSTNQDLPALVSEGRFRRDLYHRISGFPISLPPLRQRREDIPLLVDNFMKKFRGHLGKRLPGISLEAMKRFIDYDWPGNVRELRNCLERAAIIAPGGALIQEHHLSITVPNRQTSPPPAVPCGEPSGKGELEYRFSFTKETISLEAINRRVREITLAHCGGNKTRAAELLKVRRNLFYYHAAKDHPTD